MAKRNKSRERRSQSRVSSVATGNRKRSHEAQPERAISQPSPLAIKRLSPFKPRKAWATIDSPAPAPKTDFHKINSERHKQALAAAPMEREKRISKLPQLDTKPDHAKRSDVKPREVMTCKARPKNNKKHGSGSGKSFVPWCR